MKNKKGQGFLIPVMITIMMAAIIGVISMQLVQDQQDTSSVIDQHFIMDNDTCVQLSTGNECVSSISEVSNSTNSYTFGSGNYSLCEVSNEYDGIIFDGAGTVEDAFVGATLNATYSSTSCSRVTGMTGTIVDYLPVMLVLVLFVGVAGYISLKK